MIDLCPGEIPSSIDVFLINSNGVVNEADGILLPEDTSIGVVTINTTLPVQDDQRYTVVVSFRNLAGYFRINISVNVSDNSNPLVLSSSESTKSITVIV